MCACFNIYIYISLPFVFYICPCVGYPPYYGAFGYAWACGEGLQMCRATYSCGCYDGRCCLFFKFRASVETPIFNVTKENVPTQGLLSDRDNL